MRRKDENMPTFVLNRNLDCAFAIETYPSQYEDEVGTEHWNEEVELMNLRKCVKEKGCLNQTQLFALAHWKSPRNVWHIENNDDEYVQKVTEFALSTTSKRARIQSLTVLDGVGWPTASAVLHFFHNDPYPILDFRALRSAGIDTVPSTYKYEFWKKYVAFCRATAKSYGVCMRTLDRAMWCYDKITNG
ncbi:hypothetical protein [Candidatus Spongiihabitans sp.]|uniref:hypothetical protein n=1 Tax=Candidatus Spongiihabitans sp. TaxID=3101308 RepID=UPI003C7A590E